MGPHPRQGATHDENKARRTRRAEPADADRSSPQSADGVVPNGPPVVRGQAELVALQRLVGNTAVQRLLHDPPAPGQHDDPTRGAAPLTVQRRDPRANPSEKSGIERIREIHKEDWVGPFDESELEKLWSELGPAGAAKHPDDFAHSISRGMDPDNLTGAEGVVTQFKGTVEQLAREYLDGNLRDIAKEEKSLGIGAEKPSAEHDANLQDVVVLGGKAKDLRELSKSYSQVQVGYNVELRPDDFPNPDMPRRTMVLKEVPATFAPGKPPEKPLKGNEGPGARPFEAVAANYEQTMGGLMAIANQHPSIYLALKSGQLDAVSGGPTQEMANDPRAGIASVLASGRKAIEATRADSPDWEELKPIHGQLLRGEKKAGGLDWSSPWYREIVKDEVGDYETTQTLIDVGIGLAAACAFIFSELATGGLATVFWAGVGLGVGGANVARKYDKYDELKAAAAAGTSTATELVEGDQVNAAAIDLIIESAFFFLDAAGVAVKGVKGAAALGVKKSGKEVAEKAAGVAALKKLDTLSPQEANTAILQGIEQLGVKGTAEAAGTNVETLMLKVSTESPAHRKLLEFTRLARAGVEPAQLPQALKAVAGGGEVLARDGVTELTAEQVVKQAIDEIGFQRTIKEAGGWKTLGTALGPSSEVGKRLNAWRMAIRDDLIKYVESLRTAADGDGKMIQATGTIDNITNDVDMSLLGPRATENKAKAAQYLAGRTGLGSDPGTLDKMLYIGLFTDPRRIHLFDSFPELQAKLAKRTMKFEEELIWNDEYAKHLTKAAKGDAAARQMAGKIGAEMDALGVAKLPNFTPLSERAVDVLSKEQDGIHVAIEAAHKAGDTGRVEQLIGQLANNQAQINVKEGGGYFSGGGVRRFVTDKEGFPGTRAAVTGAHDLGAALDQVGKLRKAVASFEAEALKVPATRDATELAKHIKDLAKYGDRFNQVAEVLGKDVPGGAVFRECADEFSDLILQARGATPHTLQQLLARNMDGVIAKTNGAIARFDQLHVDIIRALRDRAAIEGIGDLAPDILRATKVRYALLTFRSALVTQMGTAARTVGIPIQHAVRDDEGG